MHNILFRLYIGLCFALLFEISNAEARGQAAEVQPPSSELPDSVDAAEAIESGSAAAILEADADTPMTERDIPIIPEFPGIFENDQNVVFSGFKEVVSPSMKLLPNAGRLTDPKNCGAQHVPCLLVFGEVDSEFYAIKQRTFARHAEGPLSGDDFGDRGVNNMLAANFLQTRILHEPQIIQLGETGVDYWIIPICGVHVRFKKRIPVKQFPDHAAPVQLKC